MTQSDNIKLVSEASALLWINLSITYSISNQALTGSLWPWNVCINDTDFNSHNLSDVSFDAETSHWRSRDMSSDVTVDEWACNWPAVTLANWPIIIPFAKFHMTSEPLRVPVTAIWSLDRTVTCNAWLPIFVWFWSATTGHYVQAQPTWYPLNLTLFCFFKLQMLFEPEEGNIEYFSTCVKNIATVKPTSVVQIQQQNYSAFYLTTVRNTFIQTHNKVSSIDTSAEASRKIGFVELPEVDVRSKAMKAARQSSDRWNAAMTKRLSADAAMKVTRSLSFVRHGWWNWDNGSFAIRS